MSIDKAKKQVFTYYLTKADEPITTSLEQPPEGEYITFEFIKPKVILAESEDKE